MKYANKIITFSLFFYKLLSENFRFNFRFNCIFDKNNIIKKRDR